MTIISTLRTAPQRGFIPGVCPSPACAKPVYESMLLLDDAYNVWMGKCPHCGALSYLGLTSLRGYNSAGMTLVLPTEEEVKANGLPADTPTRPMGKSAVPMVHGTVAGEIAHRQHEGESL